MAEASQWISVEIVESGANISYAPLLGQDIIVFLQEEEKARELFKALQPRAYAEYEASGFWEVTAKSSIFPVCYTVYPDGIHVYSIYWPKICVAPKNYTLNPNTDSVLQLYLMLKWDEEYVLRIGNWGAGWRKAWLVLCEKYPFHALRYYLLRLSRKVSTVLSFCTGGKR